MLFLPESARGPRHLVTRPGPLPFPLPLSGLRVGHSTRCARPKPGAAMQRLLLIVLALAAAPAARACSQATQDRAMACFAALATPISTVLAGCILSISPNITWN